MIFDDRYAALNAQQRQAVDEIYGPVVVIAGPGTGKTELLAVRAGRILRETDVEPRSILFLTYTDAAARNMRERLVKLIGPAAYQITIHTFHSFGASIIRQFPESFFGAHDFQALDAVKRKQILDDLFEHLPPSDVLSSFSDAHGFAYAYDAQSRVADLRRAGLNPSDFRRLVDKVAEEAKICNEILLPAFLPRLSKASFATIEKALAALETKTQPNDGAIVDFIKHLTMDLSLTLDEAQKENSTAPLSKWKADFIKKDEDGESTFLRPKDLAKWISLANLYQAYQDRLKKDGHFDFDDMILLVIETLKEDAAMRATIQETYQFVMVDEYQDTSTAQLQLLLSILPTDEDPNLLVVGDDDQSIYSFQGANIKNLEAFFALYPAAKHIFLENNYRSGHHIVNLSQEVIGQATKRIDQIIPGQIKTAKSFARNQDGAVEAVLFPDRQSELFGVVEKVKEYLASGVKASEIAVLAREHKQLVALATICQAEGVTVNYERKQNALEAESVLWLRQLLQCTNLVAQMHLSQAHQIFFELLRHSASGVKIADAFKALMIAKDAKTNIFLVQDHPDVPESVATWLRIFELAAKNSLSLGAEKTISFFLGQSKLDDTEFTSLFEYYLSDQQPPMARFDQVTALKAVLRTLRGFAVQGFLSLQDALECLKLYSELPGGISTKHSLKGADSAIHLITSHSAKGQEFSHVFIIHCDDDTWFSKKGIDKLRLPINIPEQVEHDDEEAIRLFYVALTRAKNHLYLTRSKYTDDGKLTLPNRLLNLPEAPGPAVESPIIHTLELLPLASDEPSVLRGIMEKYVLSPTHLDAFLNVTKGGPEHFKWYNLYGFPQTKAGSAEFGTIVHNVLALIYNDKGDLQDAQTLFEDQLTKSRMNEREKEQARHDFQDQFPTFYKNTVAPQLATEQEYKLEYQIRATVHDRAIKGSIDKIILKDDDLVIVDYKTGAPHISPDHGTDDKKLKLYNYCRQLDFYQILVREDGRFSKYTQRSSRLEYVKPAEGKTLAFDYAAEHTNTARVEALIVKVWSCLERQVFPDTSQYSQDLAGIRAFEDDLLTGKYDA